MSKIRRLEMYPLALMLLACGSTPIAQSGPSGTQSSAPAPSGACLLLTLQEAGDIIGSTPRALPSDGQPLASGSGCAYIGALNARVLVGVKDDGSVAAATNDLNSQSAKLRSPYGHDVVTTTGIGDYAQLITDPITETILVRKGAHLLGIEVSGLPQGRSPLGAVRTAATDVLKRWP